MCRDDKGKIYDSIEKLIGDIFVLVVEVFDIREAIKKAIISKMDNLIMESDSYIVINSFLRKTMDRSSILNIVFDIITFAQNFRPILFYLL